jgi:hypothetical protein
MSWLVTLKTETCASCVVRVIALNRPAAEKRAAEKLENQGHHVVRVLRCLRAA